MNLPTLVLPLKAEYFHAIKSGEKTEEYRLYSEYWYRRLVLRDFDRIVLTLGYPKRDDHARRLILPWRGYVIRMIQHPQFGAEPVRVFAIDVRAIATEDAARTGDSG
jgi:hypothetical protein